MAVKILTVRPATLVPDYMTRRRICLVGLPARSSLQLNALD